MPPDPPPVVYCREKVRHPSRKIATENLKRVRVKLRRKDRERGALVIYRCVLCGGWHLGNRVEDRDGIPRAGRPKPPPPEPTLEGWEDAA